MDINQIILLSTIIVLTVFLVVLGFQAYFTLRDLRSTLRRANKVLADADEITTDIKKPIESASDVLTAVTGGSKMIHLLTKGKTGKDKHPHLSTFLAGFILADTISHLFGTEGAQRLKEEIVKEGGHLLENIGQDMKEVKEKIEEVKEEAKEKVAENVRDVKETLEKTVPEVPKHIEQIQKKGRRFFFRKPRAES